MSSQTSQPCLSKKCFSRVLLWNYGIIRGQLLFHSFWMNFMDILKSNTIYDKLISVWKSLFHSLKVKELEQLSMELQVVPNIFASSPSQRTPYPAVIVDQISKQLFSVSSYLYVLEQEMGEGFSRILSYWSQLPYLGILVVPISTHPKGNMLENRVSKHTYTKYIKSAINIYASFCMPSDLATSESEPYSDVSNMKTRQDALFFCFCFIKSVEKPLFLKPTENRKSNSLQKYLHIFECIINFFQLLSQKCSSELLAMLQSW